MRRLLIATGAAALLAIAMVATVAAAGPMGRAGGSQAAERAGGAQVGRAGAQANVIADILGLTRDAIEDLRHDGLSLAQIAEKQKVDPQKLVDALVAQWTIRLDARVQTGALAADQATALKAQLATRAKDMVYRTTLGGMQGAAVGAGRANAPGNRDGAGTTGEAGTGWGGRGHGAGKGACNGTGPRVTQP